MKLVVPRVSRTILTNFIRHADTHNRIQEENECWRQYKAQQQNDHDISPQESRSSSPHEGPSRGRLPEGLPPTIKRTVYRDGVRGAHMDSPSETAVRSYEEGGERDEMRSTYWMQKLYQAEQQDSERWGHSGYSQLYPEDFNEKKNVNFSINRQSPERRNTDKDQSKALNIKKFSDDKKVCTSQTQHRQHSVVNHKSRSSNRRDDSSVSPSHDPSSNNHHASRYVDFGSSVKHIPGNLDDDYVRKRKSRDNYSSHSYAGPGVKRKKLCDDSSQSSEDDENKCVKTQRHVRRVSHNGKESNKGHQHFSETIYERYYDVSRKDHHSSKSADRRRRKTDKKCSESDRKRSKSDRKRSRSSRKHYLSARKYEGARKNDSLDRKRGSVRKYDDAGRKLITYTRHGSVDTKHRSNRKHLKSVVVDGDYTSSRAREHESFSSDDSDVTPSTKHRNHSRNKAKKQGGDVSRSSNYRGIQRSLRQSRESSNSSAEPSDQGLRHKKHRVYRHKKREPDSLKHPSDDDDEKDTDGDKSDEGDDDDNDHKDSGVKPSKSQKAKTKCYRFKSSHSDVQHKKRK